MSNIPEIVFQTLKMITRRHVLSLDAILLLFISRFFGAKITSSHWSLAEPVLPVDRLVHWGLATWPSC